MLSAFLVCFKVHIFWEGHKILQNLQLTFDKSRVKISQNFLAFSEYMNFKCRFHLDKTKLIMELKAIMVL